MHRREDILGMNLYKNVAHTNKISYFDFMAKN